MLMVDDLVAISNENTKTTFLITKKCVLVNNNKLSEAGLIENAAQTSSTIVGQDFFNNKKTKDKNVIGFISAIKKVVIYELPSVNDTITTKSSLISRFDSDDYTICTLSCTTTNNNKEIANFTMNLFIREV